MKLTLGREDLKKQFENVSCSLTKFEHFNLKAQEAIKIVGRATFKEFIRGRETYNKIYPPIQNSEND